MSNIAIETLLRQRQKLVEERDKMWAKFSDDLREIDHAIESISGKKVSEVVPDFVYDDEHPDYIKGSLEEM